LGFQLPNCTSVTVPVPQTIERVEPWPYLLLEAGLRTSKYTKHVNNHCVTVWKAQSIVQMFVVVLLTQPLLDKKVLVFHKYVPLRNKIRCSLILPEVSNPSEP
jgi:hypothetical protein